MDGKDQGGKEESEESRFLGAQCVNLLVNSFIDLTALLSVFRVLRMIDVISGSKRFLRIRPDCKRELID
jgi:hypothetical protein